MRCANIEKIYPKLEIDYFIPEELLADALEEYFAAVIQPVRREVNRFHTFKEGVIFDDGFIRVTAIPTAHTRAAGRPSFAFLVEAEGRRVVFSGDLSQHLEFSDIPSAVYEERVDLFVLELAHFSLDELSPFLEGMKVDRLVFNHVSLYEEKLPKIKEFASKNDTFPIECSFDGYSVEL